MKACACCKAEKSPEDFTKSKGRPDGLNPYCRICTRAKVKAFDAANPGAARRRSSEWYSANKAKHQGRSVAWLAAHPGKAAEYCARWREKNPGANAAASRKWYAANREAALAADRAQRQANLQKFLIRECASYAKRADRRRETAREWRSLNKERINFYASKRRSDLAKRTPIWLTEAHLGQMLAVFAEAARLSKVTGAKHHVDHIVPLRGKLVSGLNVPWNLQAIPALDNLKKSNSHAA